MEKSDQEIRRLISEKYPSGRGIEPEDAARWEEIDSANTARLEEIIEARGWPGKSLVGEDGASAAFLIAQHADRDPDFQRRTLKLMEAAAAAGEANPRHLAYLTDRVRVKDGLPQVYGTQMTIADGVPVPHPIEDEANVDKRRAEVGLEPLSEYIERIRK